MNNYSHNQRVMNKFDTSADYYNKYAIPQLTIGKKLLDMIEADHKQSLMITDLGCGSGTMNKNLQEKFPCANIYAIDISYRMLKSYSSTQGALICADMEELPLKTASQDLIYANFSMHWCENIAKTIAECFRILKNNGTMLITIPGPKTFYELSDCYNQLNNKSPFPFLKQNKLISLLKAHGFQLLKTDDHFLKFQYHDIYHLLKEIKQTGVSYQQNHTARFLSKSFLSKLNDLYIKQYSIGNKITASYQANFLMVKKNEQN